MKTAFFDLETQWLFEELGMINYKNNDPTKLKIAVAGVLQNGKTTFFNENETVELIETLKKADKIVGHNLFGFDYLVLQPYIKKEILKTLHPNTLDMMHELNKLTGCFTKLDDLGKRNVGMSKSIDTKKIPKMWRDGKHNAVRDYLLNDLKMTEAIFNHGKKFKKLKYEHKDYGKSLGEREVRVKW